MAWTMTPLFADRDGKQIAGPKVSFLSSHIGPPNSRKSGLWFYITWERDAKAVAMTGLCLEVYYVGGHTDVSKRRTILIKDFGLERLDYAQAPLYYVVGNYRDNFNCTGFNGAMARAPDGPDRRIAYPLHPAGQHPGPGEDGPAAAGERGSQRLRHPGPPGLRHPPEGGPRHRPGRLLPSQSRFRSPPPAPIAFGASPTTPDRRILYDRLDETDRAQRPGPDAQSGPAPQGLLEINPDKPFGRLEKADPRRIDMHVGAINPSAGPIELRYATIPYDAWLPGFSAVRNCRFDHVLPIEGPGVISQSYEPKRSVELVVAELWQGGRRVDHEERPIGIRNDFDRAPEFTRRAEIPSLDDQAGPGKNWINVQFQGNPGTDIYDSIARNIDQAKKLTPNLGFGLDLSLAEPIPGVYNWDYLTPLFDLAAEKGCRLIPYMALKWPPNWAPVEFQVDQSGCAHRLGTM